MVEGDVNDGEQTRQPIITVREGSGKYWALGCLGAFVATLVLIAVLTTSLTDRIFGSGPDPETIATASLEGLREQNVLVPFSARFVAVVTSTQSRFGLSARKTLIMPGDVRYEIDLAEIGEDDIEWDEASNTLNVVLPELTVAGPEIDVTAIREYDSGGILIAVTDAEAQLDGANRAEAQQSLLRQAQSGPTMRMARDAARNAVERNFELPMRAAGIDAQVVARFRNEVNPNQMERSRNILEERRRQEQ